MSLQVSEGGGGRRACLAVLQAAKAVSIVLQSVVSTVRTAQHLPLLTLRRRQLKVHKKSLVKNLKTNNRIFKIDLDYLGIIIPIFDYLPIDFLNI